MMLKRIITPDDQGIPTNEGWLDLGNSAQAELTSEDASHPFEGALTPGMGSGWRASEPGQQIVRLLFHTPLHIKRVHLVFHESEQPRTQVFSLRWCSDIQSKSWQDIVRQQFHFNPPDTVREIEDYEVDLIGLKVLELSINPDISGRAAFASIAELRLASHYHH